MSEEECECVCVCVCVTSKDVKLLSFFPRAPAKGSS